MALCILKQWGNMEMISKVSSLCRALDYCLVHSMAADVRIFCTVLSLSSISTYCKTMNENGRIDPHSIRLATVQRKETSDD